MTRSLPDVEVLEARLLYSADVFAFADSADPSFEDTVVMPFDKDDGSTQVYNYNVVNGGTVTTAQYPTEDYEDDFADGLYLREVPVNGTLLLNGSPMVEDDLVSYAEATGGSLVYQHDGSATTVDTALFQHEHNGHDHDNWVLINLSVSALNNPAVLGDDTVVYTGTSGTVATTTLLANDTDADGDTLVITGFDQPTSGSLALSSTDELEFTQPNSNTTNNVEYDAAITVRELDSSYVFALPLITSTNELTGIGAAVGGNGTLSTDGSGASFVALQNGLNYGAFTFPDSFEVSIEVNADSISSSTSDLLYSVGRAADVGSITVYTAEISGKDFLIAHMGGDGSLPSNEGDLNSTGTAVMHIELDSSTYLNAWHTVGLTIDSSGTASLLLDGVVGDTMDVSGITFSGSDFRVGNDIFGLYSRPFDGHLRNLFVRDLDGLGTTSPPVIEADSTLTFRRFGDAPSSAQTDSYTLLDDGTIASSLVGVDTLAANDTYGTSGTVTHTWILHEDATYGTATVNADGSFSYAQTAPTRLADHFEYSLVSEYSDGASVLWTTTSTVDVDLDASGVVLGARPVAVNDDLTVNEGGTVSVTDAGQSSLVDNDTDADGNSITVSGHTNPTHGSVTVNADGTFSYVHDGSENFTDQFTYTVVDQNNDAGAAPATVNISINRVNDNFPVATDDALTVDYGGTATTLTGGSSNLLDNDTDVDDGDTLRAEVVNLPTKGTVTINSDGTFSYVHDGSLGGGTDTFRYRAIDGDNHAGLADVTINIGVNAAPTVSDDVVRLDEGNTATATTGGASSLLDNDSDPDGHGLVVVGHTTASYGTVSVLADGSFTYVHDGSENFSDEFRYTLQDEFGEAAAVEGVVRITIDPINENAPVVVDDALEVAYGERQTALVGGQLSLLDNDTDVDTADVLDARLETGPTKGTVTVNADGTFEYRHSGSEDGSDSFTYTVSDADGNESTGTVSITIHPEDLKPQFLGGDRDVVVHEGVSDTSDLSVFFSDEGAVTYSVHRGQQDFFSVDPTTGSLSVDASSADVGTHDFRLRVTDAAGQHTTRTFSIIVLPLDTAGTTGGSGTDETDTDSTPRTSGLSETEAEEGIETGEEAEETSTNSGEASQSAAEQVATEFFELWNHLSAANAGAGENVEIDQFAVDQGDSTRAQSLSSNAGTAGLLGGGATGLSLSTLLDSVDSPQTGALMEFGRSAQSGSLDIDSSPTLTATVTTATAATGFSLGYLLWLARSGFLLSTVLSALPAWRNIDPLPVLGSLSDTADDDDDPEDKSLSERTERD